MNEIKDFVTEYETERIWEFDNEIIENAKRYIRKWVKNKIEEWEKTQ